MLKKIHIFLPSNRSFKFGECFYRQKVQICITLICHRLTYIIDIKTEVKILLRLFHLFPLDFNAKYILFDILYLKKCMYPREKTRKDSHYFSFIQRFMKLIVGLSSNFALSVKIMNIFSTS